MQRRHLLQVSIQSFRRVLGVDFMEEREVRPEAILAEANAYQRLHHLVKQDLVSSWGELESVTAKHTSVSSCLHMEKNILYSGTVSSLELTAQITKTRDNTNDRAFYNLYYHATGCMQDTQNIYLQEKNSNAIIIPVTYERYHSESRHVTWRIHSSEILNAM
jgi:hypothetical protein